MTTILFITVGGSHQPIVTAIETLQPDRTIFICSTGTRGSENQVVGTDKPCEVRRGQEVIERLPNIPTQVGLGESFNPDTDLIRLDDPDDFAENYSKIVQVIQQIQQEEPTAQLLADYTGGTKTMSVSLALAALDYRLTLYLTTGNRTDLLRVSRGELTGQTAIAPVIVQRTLDQFLPTLLQQYNYAGATAELRRLLSDLAIPTANRRQVQDLYNCCQAFDAWDRFDHLEAWELLSPYMRIKMIQPLGLFLRKVLNSRASIDPDFQTSEGTTGHGYEVLEDLLLNAERRATQHRYDDAVGRLYRALELLAQIRLLQAYEIQTGDVALNKLPSELQSEYESKRATHNQKIQLALRNSYYLLFQLDDPLGKVYNQHANQLLDALHIRNDSLFAHGFDPISQVKYEQLKSVVVGFITQGIGTVTTSSRRIAPVQLPQALSLT